MPYTAPTGGNPLAQILRNRRKEMGLTLLDVATRAGLSEGYISRVETGKRTQLTEESAIRLAQALNLDPLEVKRLGGILDPDAMLRAAGVSDFRRVVLNDPRLSQEQKTTLLSLYSTWVGYKVSDETFIEGEDPAT